MENIGDKMTGEIVRAVEKVPGLLRARYFDRCLSANSKCCVIGALIKALPENTSNEVFDLLRGSGNFLNIQKIDETPMVPITKILTKHYNCTVDDLIEIQEANDNFGEQEKEDLDSRDFNFFIDDEPIQYYIERKKFILEFLKSRALVTV